MENLKAIDKAVELVFEARDQRCSKTATKRMIEDFCERKNCSIDEFIEKLKSGKICLTMGSRGRMPVEKLTVH